MNRPTSIIRRTGRRGIAAPRSAFTLIEMLVATALLVAVIIMVTQIFNISQEAASRTNAQAEVFNSAASLRERMTGDFSRILPGLLIIESPPPTPVRAETPGGEAIFRLRQDRLVFVAGGKAGQYESFTDPSRGEPGSATLEQIVPTTAASALIYYGPGIPLTEGNVPRPLGVLNDPDPPTAFDWVFVNRTILIGRDAGSGYNPPVAPAPSWAARAQNWRTAVTNQASQAFALNLNSSPFVMPFVMPFAYTNDPAGGANLIATDVLMRDSITPNAIPNSGSELIARVNSLPPDLNPATFGSHLAGLWTPSFVPRTSSLRNPEAFDYYTRSGSTFVPRMADIRIEWTDGQPVDPDGADGALGTADDDYSTRWFGLKPVRDDPSDPENPNSLANSPRFHADRRGNVTNDPYNNGGQVNWTLSAAARDAEWQNTRTFGRPGFNDGRIESFVADGPNASYRAIWGTSTWALRPKAIRITYRLFDARSRLSNSGTVDLNDNGRPDNGTPNDTGNAPPYLTRRWGQEFSFIIPVP